MPKLYKIMFSVSLIAIVASLVLFLIYGLNLGIDFRGGSAIELEFEKNRPAVEELKEIFKNYKDLSVTQAGEKGIILKTIEINEDKHQEILAAIRGSFPDSPFEEKRFDSIGSVLGEELKRKSVIAIVIALILISLYLAIVFSKIGGIVSPWVLALGAIAALLHDLLLPVGVFSWLGHFRGVTIDAPLIAAALAILGYSINDTIVVYDRIRENIIRDANLRIHANDANDANDFSQIVHKSIKQTLVRSINTTLTTLFAVIAIYIFGGPTLKNFSLALIIGIASGAYSSIFVASPILMMLHTRK